jgi:acyl carrier protein
MIDQVLLEQQIGKIFADKLNLTVSSVDSDLFVGSGLDSLTFVELLAQLETEYGITIQLDDLELDNFRSIGKIGNFITQRLNGRNEPVQQNTVIDAAAQRHPARRG